MTHGIKANVKFLPVRQTSLRSATAGLQRITRQENYGFSDLRPREMYCATNTPNVGIGDTVDIIRLVDGR